jgi:hypothetical protein
MKISLNKLYYFRYNNPKGLGVLPVFDRAPLVCPIGVKDGFFLGVNLHWVEKTQRKKFFKFIQLRFEKHTKDLSKTKIKNFPMILYKEMKTLKTFAKGLGAIRKYIIKRMTKVTEVLETEYIHIFTPKYRSRFAYKSKGYVDSAKTKAKTTTKDIKKGSKNLITKKQQRK